MSIITIHKDDNVGVCLDKTDRIPAGHKIALKDLSLGEYVIKYGQIIGRSTADIKKGDWVHSHNLRTQLDESVQYSYHFHANTFPGKKLTFHGYKRKGRRAGIRNEIYIIPTVGCVNNVCMRLAKDAQHFVRGSLDGIFALTHPFGCSQLGQDQENIKHLLCAISQNPNASYVLFVGLGCENNGLGGIRKCLEILPNAHIAFLNCQDVEDEHSAGLKILQDFAEKASVLQREAVDCSELCIGLKCGGSDGYSGITANPLVGRITDQLVAAGGSAILTEVPEMFGAEQLLMNKCASIEIFEKYKAMIDAFKCSYIQQGFPVYENPSPGNREGGITTLEEKSLGCIEKAGSTQIVDVLQYGQLMSKQGVSVLNAPGNDLIASTALAASGCQIVLFTTGRGTPFNTFVPTMKIATNSFLSSKKSGWIDFNAYTMDQEGLFCLLMEAVNGMYRCKGEDIREIAFYKTGVTL